MTHHSLILLTFNDLEQVDHVLVEIKDLRAQLEVGVAQQIQLVVLLNVLTARSEVEEIGKVNSQIAHATCQAHRTCTHFTVKLFIQQIYAHIHRLNVIGMLDLKVRLK